MKKFFFPLLLCLATLLYAEDPQGIFVNVELLSGTKQKAQFLGIEKDTVHLGGYINNKFTVVRIAKGQFKSIVDEKGNDLLHQAAKDTISVAHDSTTTPASTDSTTQNVATDSATATPNNFVASKIFIPFSSKDLGNTTEKESFVSNVNIFTFTILQSLYSGIKVFDPKVLESICSDNLCIQRTLHERGTDTLFVGKISHSPNTDSVKIELSSIVYEDSLPLLYKAEKTFSISHFADDALSANKMKDLLAEAVGAAPAKVEKDTKSYIHVETDPEGATLSMASEYAICKTPCTFATQDTGKIKLYAYWNVDQHLWGSEASLKPIPGDTTKISLHLKRVDPELRIITSPAGAEIFPGNEKITAKSESIGTAPGVFPIWEPGMVHFKLRKLGFQDTLVSLFVPPTSETTINVNLELSSDLEEIQMQEQWQKERKTHFIGEILMGSSIAPIVVGAIFTYLAYLDYGDADDIKSDLSIPAASEGTQYQAKLKENKDLVDKGDTKMIVGGSLIGTGIALFGMGLFLTF
ncbi:MAG: hypothetical protein MJY47_04335 [Fibrobacter sp.]|nr:hypothetical protein [Fibrobacter sp.]